MYNIPKESCSFLSNINSVCMDILKSLEIENVHSIEYVVINNVETSAKTKFIIWYTLGFPDNEEPYITNQVVEIYVEDLIEENFPINHYKRLKKKYIDTYNKRIERERKISEAQRIKEEKEATNIWREYFEKGE